MAWAWAPPNVSSLAVQSGGIAFTEWVTLLTLCFAPLVAHLIAGTPLPTYLSRTRQPKWHDYLCLYSPISIIWRYAAIADRRIRARVWRPVDMAAANAIFWTEKGWDGTEAVAVRSEKYCVTPPPSSHASVFSWEFIKTAIVTLQGVQSVYVFGGGIAGTTIMPRFALDTIFFPAAFLGLLRLFAAVWLTDEYAYAVPGKEATPSPAGKRDDDVEDDDCLYPDRVDDKTPLSSSFPDISRHHPDTNADVTISGHHSQPAAPPQVRTRLSRLFRTIYVTPVILLWVVTLLFLIPGPWQDSKKYPHGRTFSLTTFFGNIYAIFFFFAIFAVYSYYAWNHGCRSTVIPCISAPWYKVLVGATFVGLIPLLVFSALETRRTPCGVYTTGGREKDDYVCKAFWRATST